MKRRTVSHITTDFPSLEEQELVRKYVMERPLYRPKITYLKASFLLLGIMIISTVLSIVLYKIICRDGFILPKKIFYISFFSLELIFLARFIAITTVKLYQHYAPENIRRRCLLKPTCSEYAIIVLKKYGVIIGLIKIWRRLKYYCRGDVYYIHEP